MLLDNESTICGIATGHVNGIRGSIRIAGWEAISVLERSQPLPDALRNARSPVRVTLEWNLASRLGAIPVDVWYWPTHRSYAGMPSIELHTLGNQVLLNRVLEQLCAAGARLALPGEFTLRAFLAGRMDLTQCEAVLGVIEAESQDALEVALRQLAGGLSEPLAELRKALIELLADIEAGLDFVDEDIQFISPEQVIQRLALALDSVADLHRTIHQRQSSQQVAKIVFLGLPNAGKSSLVNALAKENAVIVSEQAGTTRDFVRVRCSLPHGDIDLIDTAGIEIKTTEEVALHDIHRAAQHHTQTQRDEADLQLYCIDSQLASKVKREEWKRAATLSRAAEDAESDPRPRDVGWRVWLVWTKTDRARSISDLDSLATVGPPLPAFATSSRDPTSFQPLLKALDGWLVERDHERSSVAPMTSVRCKDSLAAALESLAVARTAAEQQLGDEIVAGELRMALEQLAQVAGQVYTDDVLTALFSRFCIGK